MGRLVDGAMIILFLLVVGAVVAFIRLDSQPGSFNEGGCSDGNATECGEPDDVGFLEQVQQANPTEIDEDAPPFLNNMWLLIVGFLFVLATLLIALAFVFGTSE